MEEAAKHDAIRWPQYAHADIYECGGKAKRAIQMRLEWLDQQWIAPTSIMKINRSDKVDINNLNGVKVMQISDNEYYKGGRLPLAKGLYIVKEGLNIMKYMNK